MKRIIRDATIVEDDWVMVASTDLPELLLPVGSDKLIMPLERYLAWQGADQLAGERQRVGVLLGPDDAPEAIFPFIEQLPVIAVHFPAFTDGRGYSLGRLIRMRYGFLGELRAVGDILRDQLYFLDQCGFNAFDLRAGQDVEEAVSAFGDYHWPRHGYTRPVVN